MQLQEMVKNFIYGNEIKGNKSAKKNAPYDQEQEDRVNPNPDKESSVVKDHNVIITTSDDVFYPNTGSFFDTMSSSGSVFGKSTKMSATLNDQKIKIQKYRALAMNPDVVEALDEIVNEIIFIYNDKVPIKIDVDDDNEKLREAITEKFNKITKMMNIKRNMFNIVKSSYIDGQIIAHCSYDQKTVKNGIKNIKIIEPTMFYFDKNEMVYRYHKPSEGYSQQVNTKEDPIYKYSPEEIVREDFGLYNNNLILSYLEYAIKPANMLKTLEDLLVPLRFSRSISRRVFNVDIGELPTKRGEEVMRETRKEFQYKKFYNNDTGEVSNQQHITAMVEDYWFSNRSGGRGTTVDVLDETGNLGEFDDILYFARKLYRALKIPKSRLSIDPDVDHEFDYESTRTSKEDLKFFMFISRIRQVYSSFFKEILKREVIASELMSMNEWNEKEDKISISFINENKFVEKMDLENFMSKLTIYSTAQEYNGKLFSVEKILKTVFGYSEDEIEEEFKKIESEEKNPLYAKFYNTEEDAEY